MTQRNSQNDPSRRRFLQTTGLVAGALTLGVTATGNAAAGGRPDDAGQTVVNGWYETEEIYYLAKGVEEGVTERGENDIYLIGGNRLWQAQVVEFIPGEPGYSPHWNVNVVHTADGVKTEDIAASDWASDRFNENGEFKGPLFDDLADILGAESDGLVTINKPGAVVLCPIVPEETADAPGNTEGDEDFPPFEETF